MNQKNILIYPHYHFDIGNGGMTVTYYLANQLEKYGQTVRIHPCRGAVENDIFSKYYYDDFPIDDNCVVIYCEGVTGNPLNAKNVVRWMLSRLGQNVPYNMVEDWGKNELVYFFCSEKMINDNPEKINTIFKFLPILYNNPILCVNEGTTHKNRCCHVTRKHFIHENGYTPIHPPDSYHIAHTHTQIELVSIFNSHEMCISYDPISFISMIAAMCGCISVVYPIDGMDELQWMKLGATKEYIESKNINKYYGIAYGLENVEWAKSTIHLAKKQWEDIVEFNINKYLPKLIEDINQFDKNENTIQNVYYNA